MDKDLEINQNRPEFKTDSPIETPDGKSIYLFRYDNPLVPNRNPDSSVSQEGIVGKWFTDSLRSLKTYILMRPPGGSIVVAQVPKDRAEEFKATNHPLAKDMDMEPTHNYILTDNHLGTARTIPFDIPHRLPNKYMFDEDLGKISNFLDNLRADLEQSAP